MQLLQVKWGFDCCLTVDHVGKSGGLDLLWLNDINLQIESYSSNHIDATIDGDNGKLRFTCFYGFPEIGKRPLSWQLLRTLHSQFSLPWICVGDYNELLSLGEKLGGASHLVG